jgi:hypothetical protein
MAPLDRCHVVHRSDLFADRALLDWFADREPYRLTRIPGDTRRPLHGRTGRRHDGEA